MLSKAAALARLDFAPTHRQPAGLRVVVATVISLVGSLAADALLVVLGQAAFPATRGYVHFQFADYAKLTIIGVVIACAAWPITTRISSAPRWLFLRMAVLVTLVLWLPDLYILHGGQSGTAVAVLMLMHVAIALVTYNALVRIAPTKAQVVAGRRDRGRHAASLLSTGTGPLSRAATACWPVSRRVARVAAPRLLPASPLGA